MLKLLKTAIAGFSLRQTAVAHRPFFKASHPEVNHGKEVYLDIYGRPVPDAEVQFYPPKIQGLSVFTEDAIMRRYWEYIDQINDTVKIGNHRTTATGENLFHARYVSIVKTLASYAHMLPASEYDHHSQPGGLFRHCLEAGLLAMQYADNKLPPTTGAVDLDEQRRPRYLFAAWLGGLLHDIGKVITDIRVQPLVMFDGKRSVSILDWPETVRPWIPHIEPLTVWAKKNKVERYAVNFVKGRFKHHETSGNILLSSIVQGEGLEFILESPDNLYGFLNAALSGYLHESDYLSNAIRYGDALSVKNDNKAMVSATFGVVKKSKKNKIISLMRGLRKDWVYNSSKAQMWIIGDAVFLRWEAAFHSIIKKSKELRIDDISQNTATLHQEMEDMSIVEVFDKENGSILFSEGCFEIEDALQIAEGNIEVSWCELIKVVHKEWVFDYDPLPPNARGIVYLQATNEFILAFEDGNTKPVNIHSKAMDKPKLDDKSTEETPASSAPAEQGNTDKSSSPKTGNSSTSTQPKQKPKKKHTAKSKPVKDKVPAITFVNGKNTKHATAKVEESQAELPIVVPEQVSTQSTDEARPQSVTPQPKEQPPAPEVEVKSGSSNSDDVATRITSIAHLIQPVKSNKFAALAEDVSNAWGITIKEAGIWLKENKLLKVKIQSIALTFSANDKKGIERQYFAFAPSIQRFIKAIEEKPVAPAQNKTEESNPTALPVEAEPKEVEVPGDTMSIQVDRALHSSPNGTFGYWIREIIQNRNPLEVMERRGQDVYMDLVHVAGSSTAEVDGVTFTHVAEALRDHPDVTLEEDGLKQFITIPISSFKKVRVKCQ
jgi:hypothetical protein